MNSLQNIKCYILDMDGTFYLGNNILPGSLDLIEYLKDSGRDFLFLTNNSSKDAAYYAAKLEKMGLACSLTDILTSGEATVRYLKTIHDKARVYVLGTPELEAEFTHSGFLLTPDKPDYVVLGFDMTLTYDKLVTACNLVRAGVPFIATHPDINCPTEDGFIPDCGAMIKLIHASTGVLPKIIGKPNREIVDAAFERKQYQPEEIAIVGDRLYTDIATGVNAGTRTILVLSGETKAGDIESSTVRPDYVFDGLQDLLANLKSLDNHLKDS